MSGVHAQAASLETLDPTTRYLDTLYDIVATGVEPGDHVTLGDIEALLHQHARRPKTLAEFREFFGRHRLGLRLEEPGGVPRILEPLPSLVPPPGALASSGPLDDDDGKVTNPGPSEAARGAQPARSRAAGVIAAAVVVLAIFGAAGAWCFLTLTQLRIDLVAANAQAFDNREAIRQLEDQAVHIQEHLAETRHVVLRFEGKHDLLLDALLSSPIERP